MSTKTIIFTGGGSGGHVMPAITLIKKLKEQDIAIHYLGSYSGIESKLIPATGVNYTGISTGKLRRYFSVQNFFDLFKVGIGFMQSFFHMLRFSNKNSLVFATGGFVTVPVVLAAKLTGKTVYLHEQTTRVGLANKICAKFAEKVFVSFEDSLKLFPKEIVELSGYPLRDEFFNEDLKNSEILGTDLSKVNKPILFATGGGNGSVLINDLIFDNFDELTKDYFIVHQVGKNYVDKASTFKSDNYVFTDFLGDEMSDLMKISSVIISRAGAGTVSELLALGKKSIFIPLKIAQKNEQFHNAMEANRLLGSVVVEEDDLVSSKLKDYIEKLNDPFKIQDYKYENGTSFLMEKIDKFFN